MMFVFKKGVAELRYLSDSGEVVGKVVDLYLVQDQLPSTPDKQKAFFLRDPEAKTQATIYCLACSCYLSNFPSLEAHCDSRRHKNQVLDKDIRNISKPVARAAEEEKHTSFAPLAPDTGPKVEVNPYHQAWEKTADECLTLVSGPGIAEFRMGTKIVDAFEFQKNYRDIPFNFFRRQPSGAINEFHCHVCSLTLHNLDQLKAHCASRGHLEAGLIHSRQQQHKPQPTQQPLTTLLLDVKEPCIGLEHVEEWWEEGGAGPPYYTCRACQTWATTNHIFKHIVGEKHRKAHLIHKYPILEKMISLMDKIELLERAQEEEDKTGGWESRNYSAIRARTDNVKYAALRRMLDGSNCLPPGGISGHMSDTEFRESFFHGRGRLLEPEPRPMYSSSGEPAASLPPRGPAPRFDPPLLHHNSDLDHRDRHLPTQPYSYPPPRMNELPPHHRFVPPPHVGDQVYGSGDAGAAPPPFMAAGPPPPRGFRGNWRGDGWRGRGFFRGGPRYPPARGGFWRPPVAASGGPLYGRKVTGELEQYRPAEDRPHQAVEEEIEDPPDAYYAVSGDQEDFGYGVRSEREKDNRDGRDSREVKQEREPPPSSYPEPGGAYARPFGGHPGPGGGHSGPAGGFYGPIWGNPIPVGGFHGHPGPGGGHPYGESRDMNRVMERHYGRRYYGPEDEIIGEVRVSGEFGREYVMERGHRPDRRYYGPEEEQERHRHRWEEEEEHEGHYEGPTIFDKVFRKSAGKSKDKSRSRSKSPPKTMSKRRPNPEVKEKRLTPIAPKATTSAAASASAAPPTPSKDDLEAEFRLYKERTEARIRREREKLLRYERKIKELTQLSGGVKARPLDIEKYERRKRRAEEKMTSSPPKAYKKARPGYTSESGTESDSDRDTPVPAAPGAAASKTQEADAATATTLDKDRLTPPPGANLSPVLSPEEPRASPEQDSCENKFDPY